MAILNYTTSVPVEKSIMQIQQILVKHGAKKIVTDYSGALPIAVTFCLEVNGQLVAFNLPANFAGVLNAMRKDKKITRAACNEDQARRVAWRIVKDWVEAQLAIVEANLAELAEVFLPYAVTKNGTTLYREIANNPSVLMLNH